MKARLGRVRPVRQTEVSECGVASLAMVASFHGLDIDLVALRRRYSPSLRGAPLKSLIILADRLGFSSRAVKLPLNALPNLRLPAVLHWDLNHYVVLERIRRGKALIHDPARGSRWFDMTAISGHFTGVALELHPTADFEAGDRREKLALRQLWQRIFGLKRALAQTLVLSLVMQAFVLASPYYLQVAVDRALPAFDRDLLSVLALGFGLFTLVNAAASLLRGLAILSAGSSLSFGIASNLARRLFRLPVEWFDRRHVGDILSRFQSIAPIQQALTQGMVAALLDGTLGCLTFLLMCFYSPLLTLIALAAFLLYLAVRLVTFKPQQFAQEASIVTGAREQSVLIETVRGITTLRLFNKEANRHALWQSALTDASNSRVVLGRIGVWQQAGSAAIFGLETIVSVWLAVGFVIAGGFSIGMVFAFLAYKTQFLARGAALVDQSIGFRMLSLHLDRLADVAVADEDISFRESLPSTCSFEGQIELRDVSYGYADSDEPVLKQVSLRVEPGEHVAITGPSGSGKTTLVKILLGLIEPQQGAVLVDRLPLLRFGHRNFHDQIAAVLQEDHLFSGTIADNIALFDQEPDVELISRAARAAAIADEIGAMRMGFETLVNEMNSTLSGGQKQRLLLARALYRQPKLLVMDEGTAHLDARHEAMVNEAISSLGITRIVIAHRTETIAAADRVFILEKGALRPAEPMQ